MQYLFAPQDELVSQCSERKLVFYSIILQASFVVSIVWICCLRLLCTLLWHKTTHIAAGQDFAVSVPHTIQWETGVQKAQTGTMWFSYHHLGTCPQKTGQHGGVVSWSVSPWCYSKSAWTSGPLFLSLSNSWHPIICDWTTLTTQLRMIVRHEASAKSTTSVCSLHCASAQSGHFLIATVKEIQLASETAF